MKTRESAFDHRFALRVVAWMAGCAVAGGVWGYHYETDANDLARKHALTAQGCLRQQPQATVINQAMMDCLHHGAGGDAVDTPPGVINIFENFLERRKQNWRVEVGAPISELQGFLQLEQHEAEHIEADRMAGWVTIGALAPFAIDAYLIAA
jgi:hypothetical protein